MRRVSFDLVKRDLPGRVKLGKKGTGEMKERLMCGRDGEVSGGIKNQGGICVEVYVVGVQESAENEVDSFEDGL